MSILYYYFCNNINNINAPTIYPFMWSSYHTPSALFFGNEVLESQVGCQQGDPAGPLTFSLSINPLVKSLKSKLNLFYLDDGTLGGHPTSVLEDISLLITKSAEMGLQVNPTKCELFFTSGIVDHSIEEAFSQVLPGIQTTSPENLTLLGTPLLEPGYEPFLKAKVEDMKKPLENLEKISSHIALHLLKTCLGIPKLIYFLRTIPTWLLKDCLDTIDQNVKLALENILNVKFNEKQWIQASLPIRKGGLGIRLVNDLSLPAFLSSCYGVKPEVSTIVHVPVDSLAIQHCDDAVNVWRTRFNDEFPLVSTEHIQKNWDSTIIHNKVHKNLVFVDPVDIARFKALQLKESNAWLHSIPSKTIGTHMENNALRVSICLRLGMKMFEPFTCICGERMDVKGLHALSCGKSPGRRFRHSQLNDIIQRALSSIDVPSKLEPAGLSRADGNRPDGLTIIPWSRGQHMIWDATCVDTLASSYISKTVQHPGSAAEIAALKKHRTYSELEDNGYIFIPFAVETMGSLGAEAKSLVNVLGSKLVEKSGDGRTGFYLSQRISLAIQRGNAAAVVGCVPQGDELDGELLWDQIMYSGINLSYAT